MEIITDKVRISVLLKQLVEKRSLVSVKLKSYQQLFSSAILDVDNENNQFILDVLKPELDEDTLKLTPRLHIRGQLGGISMKFNSTVSEFGVEDEIPFYKLPFPKEIDYFQRRQAVRVRLSATNLVSVTFSLSDGQTLSGELEDISIGGLRAKFIENLPNSLSTNEALSCSFVLPPDKEESIKCNFQIRSIKREKNKYGPAFIGGEFVNMIKPLERQLERTIMILQRASRKNEAD